MKYPMIVQSLAALTVATLVSVTFTSDSVSADEQNRESLINSLSGAMTRSFNAAPSEHQLRYRGLVDTLRKRSTRQITVEERTEVAKYVKENDLPAVDMEIYFSYNSAAISKDSIPKLTDLGDALSDEKLKGQTFMIAGHTDARGGASYNQALSERRAEAVKQYLARQFSLNPTNLIAIGYGEEQLKIPSAPEDHENRRVQVVNMKVN